MFNASAGARLATWALLALAIVFNIAGYAFDLYARWSWFDKVLHGYTIAALTLGLGLALYGRTSTGAARQRFLLIITIAALGVAVGALWEIGEWGYNQFVPSDVIKGKFDTITDMIVDTVGALIAAIAAASLARSDRPTPTDSADPRTTIH